MRKCFEHELTPIPTSRFQDALIRKPSKSSLAYLLTKDANISPPTESTFYVLDGGALLYKVK